MTAELSQLADRFLSVLPFERVQIRDSSADFYFYGLHSFDADWVINIDEDAFCYEPRQLLELLNFMATEGYDYCGMPDGGVVPIRKHNPVVPNAFFNIFNMKKIRPKFVIEDVLGSEWTDDLKLHTPPIATGELCYDEFEPYYRYFFWLLKSGFRQLPLSADTWEGDGTATILKNHLGVPFLIHAWYAREFQTNPQRFLNIASYAVKQLSAGQ